MNSYKVLCEAFDRKTVLKEYADGDLLLVASKIANEQYRINKILEDYPSAKDLSAELKKSTNPSALKLAAKLDAIGEDPKAYYTIVRKLSGRTFCRWLGNLIGGPFALIYQAMQLVKNYGGKLDGKQVVYDRI